MAANGPKAMRRGCQYADGLITDPKTWKQHKPESGESRSGSPRESAITELFDGGATIVNIHSGQADQRKVIQFYGKEVLPRLKRS